MKKIIKKAGTIAGAMLAKIPTEEPWYQERIAHCNICPHNSDNKPQETLDATVVFKNKYVCPEGRVCTACGCCIDRKALVKTEVCGLIKIGEKPLWGAIDIENPDEGLLVKNLTPNTGQITQEGPIYAILLKTQTTPTVKFDFEIQDASRMEFVSSNSSCSCTVAHPEVIDRKTLRFSVKISTISFKEGQLTERGLEIKYKNGNGVNKSISIKFRYKK